MADSKSISFALKISENDLQRMRSAIRELTGELTKLSAAAAGASKSFAGVMGGISTTGGGGSSKLSGGTPGGPAGAINAPTAASAGKSLTQVFAENANAFRNLAGVSKDSMNLITAGLKTSINDQKQQLQSLTAQLANTTSAYQRLGNGGTQMAGYGQRLMTQGAQQGVAISNLNGQLTTNQTTLAQLSGGAPGGAGGSGGGFLGMAAGAGWKGFGLAGLGLAMGAANEALSGNMAFSSEEARMGKTFGKLAYGVRQGGGASTSRALAMMAAVRSEEAGYGTSGFGAVASTVHSAGSALWGLLGGNAGSVAQTLSQIEGDKKLRINQLTENEMAANPQLYGAAADFQNDAGSNFRMMNLLGISGRRNGKSEEDQLNLMRRNVFGPNNMQDSDVSGAAEALMGSGRGFALRHLVGAHHAKMAGMSQESWGKVMAASEFSGGSKLGNLMMTAGGKNGMDRIAAQTLGSNIATQMVEAGGFVNGAPLFEAMGTGRHTVLEVQRSIEGTKGLASAMGGYGDQLGKGINLVAAMHEVGAGNIYGQNKLAEYITNPAIVAAAFRGIAPIGAEDYGITAPMIARASQSALSTNAQARLVKTNGTSPIEIAQRRLLGMGGDVKKFYAAQTHGLKGQALEDAIRVGGEAWAGARMGDPAAMEAFKTFGAFGKPTGKRAGRFGASAASSDSAALEQSQITTKAQTTLDTLRTDQAKIVSIGKNLEAVAKAVESFGALSTSAHDAEISVKAFSMALDNFSAGHGNLKELKRAAETQELERDKKENDASDEPRPATSHTQRPPSAR